MDLKRKKYKNVNTKNIDIRTNSYLEKYGLNITNLQDNSIGKIFNNNSYKQNHTYEIVYKKERAYHPLIKKISNIIIGRYKIEENDIYKNIYKNVNEYILHKYKNTKQLDDILNDTYKLNELVTETTLIISRMLFKIINEPLTKILIGQYIINKTDNNKEIESIYEYIINVALNTNYSIDIRINAVDILNLSNNRKYIEISKGLLNKVRNTKTEKTNNASFNYHLDRVINNRNNNVNNRNNNVNNIRNDRRPEVLIDVNGNMFHIPPDIDVPPLQTERQLLLNEIKESKTFYEDGQNVHNTKLNKSTLDAAFDLVNKYNPYDKTIEYTYYKKISDKENIDKIERAIHRINTDTSNFGNNLNLQIVYQSLLNLIEQHKNKDELNERLMDELIDMSGKCSTGHLSRLLNVLQGYDTNLNVKVTIDIKDEVYAKIKHLIEKNMMEQENMDDIMEDMLSDDKTIYINFVKNVINDNIFEIIKEYENVNIKDIGDNNGQNSVNKNVIIETIIECLDKYTGTKDKFSYLK
jgi:hypothetical protein